MDHPQYRNRYTPPSWSLRGEYAKSGWDEDEVARTMRRQGARRLAGDFLRWGFVIGAAWALVCFVFVVLYDLFVGILEPF